MGILDGIVEWIAEQVMAGLDLVTTSVLGALGCDMAVFLRYFPAAETMYSVFVALAIGIILLNWVWQLFKNFGLGAGVEAEDPVKLSIRSVIFILLTLFSDEIVNIVLTIGGTPYHWIMESDLPALSFADFNSVMLVIIGVCANGAVALITLILVLILAWNYLKLLFEAAERYVLLGVLVYTAPVAFSMGASQTTANIWKSCACSQAWWGPSLRTRFRYKEVLSLKKLKKFLFAAFTVAILSCLLCQPAFAAISESDVQAQVDTLGKEAVSGNVFIWFLCAIGFLKVGQKIDSFLSSLGVNVGHTGGSMLAEAMIAARGIGGIKNFSSHHFGGGRNSSSTNVNANGGKGSGGFGAGFASGGLAGVVSRKVTNSAIKTATTTPASKPSGLGSLLGDAAAGGIGGHMYASSVSKGGNFANNVIGSVATGSISQMGSISGEKAAEALHSYMGYAALESGAENVPTFQNVEIGGGRITGTEVTAEHPEGISFGMYHADQYVAPEGQYTTVHAVDGTAWYKQYAVDAVDKSPYMAPDGSIAFNESIVKKLPPAPRRKDKI